jgi:LytS/YehU family sensor histidine kinase
MTIVISIAFNNLVLENELTQSRIAIMLSQIKPHFLYNSLVVIRHLCRENPKLAEETVVEFAQYLRVNLDSLTLKTPVPFEQELGHTQTYLAIEQKRFGSKFKVMYNIKFKDFSLPALTLP